MATFNKFLTSLNLDPTACGAIIMESASTKPEPVRVRRACDECRARKLACSKDSDGCGRCRRESLVCHYSEQKQMGRPRKRQLIETTKEVPPKEQNQIANPLLDTLPYVSGDHDMYNDLTSAEPYSINGYRQPTNAPENAGCPGSELKTKWHFGDQAAETGPAINFGAIIRDFDFDHVPPVDTAPQLPTVSVGCINGSDYATSPAITTTPAGPCSCLASMYLALASLQQLPTDIVLALKTVRGAASTAASSIWCPQCGVVGLESPNPPIEGFQNTMLLGTILPIVANGYQRLLKMIDDETDTAEAAGQTKTFRFYDYGGMCGKQNNIEQTIACVEKEMFFNSLEMPARQWRMTVRALLRVDIYGHEQDDFKRKGLQDLVAELEMRQRARHEMLEAYAASGSTMVGPFGQKLCLGEQTHGCLQILAMAKAAIDSLVIP